MKLSIITVNRNNAAGLRTTLESTFGSQPGFIDWEQIVVDGASSDGSFAEVDRYRGDPRLGWCVSEPDSGIYNAMNKGAAHARGDYLLFLNSGDMLMPDVLARIFAESWEADIAFGDVLVQKPGRTELRKLDDSEGRDATYFLFCSLPHQSTLFSRNLHEKIGGYDETLRIYADRKFCLRAVLEYNPVIWRFPFVVSTFMWGGISSDPALDADRRRECEEMLVPFFGRYAAHRVCKPAPKPKPLLDEKMDKSIRDDAAFRSFLQVVARSARYFYLEKPSVPVLEGKQSPTGSDDRRLAIEFLDAAAALRGHPRIAIFVRHVLHWLAKRLRGRKSGR